MALTPIDIHNKEFEKVFRGFNTEEVYEFLERVARDYEAALKENASLREEIKEVNEKLSQYHKLEETMHNAIVVAQETAEEVKRNANKEAELIRKEAEREAQRLIEDARYRATRLLAENENKYKKVQVFKMRFRAFIEAQLASIDAEDWMDEQSSEAEQGNE